MRQHRTEEVAPKNANNACSSIIFSNRKIHLYLAFLLDKVLLELHSKETADLK